MENESKKQVENTNSNNKKLLLSDVINCSNFTKAEAIDYLQKKLFGSHEVMKQMIFESVYLIENSGYDTQKVLKWFHKVEQAFQSEI